MRALRSSRVPAGHEARIGRLGLFDPASLLVAVALKVVGVRGALLTAGGLMASLQPEVPHLLGMEAGRARR